MSVQNYTDLFNTTLNNLASKLAASTGLSVVTDPRNLQPPCIFIGAPSFEAWNGNIAKMTFPVQLISLGPGNADAERNLLNMAALVLTASVGLVSGRPTVLDIGGQSFPAYDLDLPVQAQAG